MVAAGRHRAFAEPGLVRHPLAVRRPGHPAELPRRRRRVAALGVGIARGGPAAEPIRRRCLVGVDADAVLEQAAEPVPVRGRSARARSADDLRRSRGGLARDGRSAWEPRRRRDAGTGAAAAPQLGDDLSPVGPSDYLRGTRGGTATRPFGRCARRNRRRPCDPSTVSAPAPRIAWPEPSAAARRKSATASASSAEQKNPM